MLKITIANIHQTVFEDTTQIETNSTKKEKTSNNNNKAFKIQLQRNTNTLILN